MSATPFLSYPLKTVSAHPAFFEGRDLQGGVLVDGGDAGVAVFRAGNLTLQTCNVEVLDLAGVPECVKLHPL